MYETDATVGEGQFTTVAGRPGGTGPDDTGDRAIEEPVVDTGTGVYTVRVGPTDEVARGCRPGHSYRRSGLRGVHSRGERNGGSDVDRPDAVSGIDCPGRGGGLRQKEFADTRPIAVRAPAAALDPAGAMPDAPLAGVDG